MELFDKLCKPLGIVILLLQLVVRSITTGDRDHAHVQGSCTCIGIMHKYRDHAQVQGSAILYIMEPLLIIYF